MSCNCRASQGTGQPDQVDLRHRQNGYIGTHNMVSQPQRRTISPDTANSATAGSSTIGQVCWRRATSHIGWNYLRDMGGGQKVLMKEIDAPITLSGRHWGNMRCAFVPEAVNKKYRSAVHFAIEPPDVDFASL